MPDLDSPEKGRTEAKKTESPEEERRKRTERRCVRCERSERKDVNGDANGDGNGEGTAKMRTYYMGTAKMRTWVGTAERQKKKMKRKTNFDPNAWHPMNQQQGMLPSEVGMHGKQSSKGVTEFGFFLFNFYGVLALIFLRRNWTFILEIAQF
ncbi:hypothetical protein L1987_31717 [Smallanthus sonchifolius]|uniref:Uncharacterized protein n=1 Tax=Smallanthus sonchifolius TaxID=185202 RepID=A0ACB9I7W2_9ASTR|nr:hypothetical protein L1987_31717 [Smallanthus sonchifolius]